MRIGFILTAAGFAAVLYDRQRADGTLDGATTRSRWCRDSDEVTALGVRWAEQLGVGVDVVRVDTRLLERAS